MLMKSGSRARTRAKSSHNLGSGSVQPLEQQHARGLQAEPGERRAPLQHGY